jgi:hypothetical protein
MCSFRWAHCTIHDLTRRHTPKAIQEALEGVPPTLGDIYTGILDAIPGDMMEAVTSMLRYLVSSLRQLSLAELAEAVSFTYSDGFGKDDRLIEPEGIVHTLYSLVHYDLHNQRIELAHSSVRDYLTSYELAGKYYVNPIEANICMSRLCIHYLTLPSFQTTCADQSMLETRKEEWPLLEYASFFWTRHIRTTAQSSGGHLAAFSKFAASCSLPSGGNFAAWYQFVFSQGNPNVWKTKPLYMCAREGLVEPLKILLATCTKEELEQRGGRRGSTALHVAATYGEVEAVRLLLDAGADPNECNDYGESGLQWAAFYNHVETVQLLLEAVRPSNRVFGIHKQMVQHSQIPSTRYMGTAETNKGESFS